MSARLDILAPYLVPHLLATPGDVAATRVARLLARAEHRTVTPLDSDAAVLAWFGVTTFDGVAGITAAADFASDSRDGHWLRADPVHLRADATRVIMFDADSVGLSASESDALLAHLNAGFADQGFRFERGAAPTRWYVRMPTSQALQLGSPRSLRGAPVEDSLGALRRAGVLNRALTEAQMLLYGAPVNDTRAATGRAPINSVWFWGSGTTPTLVAGERAAAVGDDDLIGACARHAGIVHEREPRRLEEVLHGARGDVLLLDHGDAAACDLGRFADGVLGPAFAALAKGRLAQVVIHVGPFEITVKRHTRWRIWRRAGAFIDALRRATMD